MKKKSGILKGIMYVIVLLLLVGSFFPTLLKNLKFGLDLKGGFEVLYEVESIDGDLTSDMVTNTYKTMLKRIDVLGVSEPSITVEGDNRIRVQLAGVTNEEEARDLLSRAASLTFRDTKDNLLMTSSVLGGASVGTDQKGRPAVSLSVKNKREFFNATKKVSTMDDNRIVIWLDFEEGVNSFSSEESNCGSLSNSKCLSVATVSQGFSSDVIIQGNFEKEEVTSLVELINSGSLPTKLVEISSKNVEASFGQSSLDKTFFASIIGIIGIILVMVLLYRFSGLISSIGILVYTFTVFLVFWVIGGVLTLPGIAAAIIGVGMAIDANVITYSRIKDELKNGTKLQMAYKLGNKNALSSILDSNITTLIVAIILFIFGESSIKGFATMLIISIVVTLLITVLLTRYVLSLFVKTKMFDDKLNLFIGYKTKKEKFQKFNFMKTKKYFISFSCIIIIIGAIALGMKGLNLGIDFKGGTSINVKSENTLKIKDLKSDIKELNYKMDSISKEADGSYSIVLEDNLTKDQINETKNYFSDKYQASTDIGVVSNVVKRELIKNAILSLLIASLGIIIYISFRFKFSYACGAIISLLHDVFIVIALFSVLRLQVSTIFIAAILSIIGYSINDTIVIFDRIKENIKLLYNNRIKKKEELENAVNVSLKQTFARSIITTITTLIPVIALIIFGSHEIINFNIALLIGLVAGSYSSIFIASQIWLLIESKNIGKKQKKNTSKEIEELTVKGINS
ncbi:MAG: protein translocase subunit SecF [Bacilli bacterium]|nr:protein translocase subunit SecF [Bacilli bacterium]